MFGHVSPFSMIKCEFSAGHGLRKGGYTCKCLDGFFSILGEFNGPEVENKWKNQHSTYSKQSVYLFVLHFEIGSLSDIHT
jgi:hypothetical protein